MSAFAIRPEEPRDIAGIAALTNAAFRNCKVRMGSEARIIERLREKDQLALSLVAENVDLAIIGHLTVSPVTISDGTRGWFALGPISVIPLNQQSGIGAALLERAISDMRQVGAQGLVCIGPPDYFARFGFDRDEKLRYDGSQSGALLRLSLGDSKPVGTVSYAPAFDE